MIYLLALAALVAGCSSGAKLNDVPVTDATGSVSRGLGGQGGGAAQGGGVQGGSGTASDVTPVTIGQPEQTEQGPVGVARIIYFDFDSYTVKSEFQPLVDSHARFLKVNAQRHVTIEGHTDERGGREYNLALGQKRSEAVRRSLVLLGVSDNQIEAVSFGKEKPAASGTGEDAWARNRRAEIVYR
jgi:peptidoglycan-associated lipoprotein